jgi:hypothetical protein
MEAARIDGSAHPAGLLDMPVDEALAPTLRELASRVARMAHLMPCAVLLPDGRLCVTYGHRKKPTGIRARISADEGKTWTPEIILRDDGFDGDLGYPRSVVRPDGRVLTIYYFNGPKSSDRCIESTFWMPPVKS